MEQYARVAAYSVFVSIHLAEPCSSMMFIVAVSPLDAPLTADADYWALDIL
jgi:hypothetical protein